jgi:CheY-like chemotaxis protein
VAHAHKHAPDWNASARRGNLSHEETDVLRSYQLGVNAYVVKPVEFKQFVEAIADLGIFWAVLNEPPPGSLRTRRRHE